MRTRIRILMLVIVLFACVGLSTCMQAEERDLVIYDGSRDEFRVLMVLRDIQATGPNDITHLEALWKNRDFLVAPIVPGSTVVPYMLPWFVVLEDHQAQMDWFMDTGSKMDVFKVDASLKSIRIQPGAFFMEGKKLCYYHAMVVPGKVLDDVLLQAHKTADELLAGECNSELNRRAEGGKTHTWAEYKSQEITALEKEDTQFIALPVDSAPDLHPIPSFMVMEEQSLRNLAAKLKAGQMVPARKGEVLTVTLPLTATDRAGMADCWEAYAAKIQTEIAKGRNGPLMQWQHAVTDALKVTNTNELTLTLNLPQLCNELSAAMPARMEEIIKPTKPGATMPAPLDLVAALKEKQIPIEPLGREQIFADFKAGTLKSYPSAMPVVPGTGLNEFVGKPAVAVVTPPESTVHVIVVPPPKPVVVGTAYAIKKGDTLSALAVKFGVTERAMENANPGVDPLRLQIGHTIQIPAGALRP